MHPSLHAAEQPDKVALIVAETGATVSYRELDARSNQSAHVFRRDGLRQGEMVALLIHNCPQFLELAWAAQRSGLYYVCVPTRLTAAEPSYLLAASGAKMLIYSADLLETASEALTHSPGIRHYSVGGVTALSPSFERERATMPTGPISDEAPGQDMLYSSGTTGKPKGIKRARPTGSIDEPAPVTKLACDLYGMDGDTIYLSPAPLYHAAPLRFCMAVQQLGGTVVVMEKFDPEQALALIQRFRVTHAQWVPTHFVRMLRLPSEIRQRYDTSSLVATFHAAAPCPVEIKQAMLDWWGPIVHEYYSSTELNGFTAATPNEWLSHKGTVGRAILGKIKICDENGEPLPPRAEGAVYFQDGAPIEYHNDAHKTRQAANQYGWTTVGDIGWVDEEGYLYLTDRQTFMIISGGVNIYPQEIENLLSIHPRVVDAAVVGAPDADLGERVVAVVQPVDWGDANAGFARELTEFLRTRLNRQKVPRQIDFMEELPRQPTGKLFKRQIRDGYWAHDKARSA